MEEKCLTRAAALWGGFFIGRCGSARNFRLLAGGSGAARFRKGRPRPRLPILFILRTEARRGKFDYHVAGISDGERNGGGRGNDDVTLGADGALSVALVPNAGRLRRGCTTPSCTRLGREKRETEYWIVPTTSPANLAAVRTTPGSGVAGQPVSMQYVNSELATKANDSAVVHLNGTETISGTKTFAAAPTVPAPTSTGQVANKAYVDSSVSNVGAGNFLPTAGGTMTGPIVLPGLR